MKDTGRQKQIAESMRLFLNVSRLHKIKTEEALDKLPSTPSQHKMLATIDQKKLDSQKSLSKELNISSAAVAVTLTKLEKANFIEKKQTPEDKRANGITITDAGKELLKTTKHAFQKMDEEFFKPLSDDELASFIEILRKLDRESE